MLLEWKSCKIVTKQTDAITFLTNFERKLFLGIPFQQIDFKSISNSVLLIVALYDVSRCFKSVNDL